MIGDAMRRDAQNWNRRQPRNDFLTITMNVKSSPQEVLLPIAATEPMRLKITCVACQCRYSVIGSAYFCPACGHNAADRIFEQSLDRIRAALAAAPTIPASIAHADIAKNTVRLLTENGLQHAVTAFQRFAEALYAQSANSSKTRKNIFQNINEGSRLWEEAFGTLFSAYLPADELQTPRRYFQ